MIKFRQVKQKVARMLDRNPHCKDDDRKLSANIWAEELSDINNGDGYKWADAHDFLDRYAKGQLTAAPTIKRARAKLQQDFPQYRGIKYEKRQNVFQEEIKKEIIQDNGYSWLPYKD